MATTKQMQQKAKLAKKAAKEAAKEAAKGFVNLNQTYKVGNMMLVDVEAAKMMKIATTDKSPIRTKCNSEDFKHMPYKRTDSGFFVAYVRKEHNGVAAYDYTSAKKVMDQFQVVDAGKFARFSTYCTWDKVEEFTNQVCENFDYAVVGYSTPQQLMLLAENPVLL